MREIRVQSIGRIILTGKTEILDLTEHIPLCYNLTEHIPLCYNLTEHIPLCYNSIEEKKR